MLVNEWQFCLSKIIDTGPDLLELFENVTLVCFFLTRTAAPPVHWGCHAEM